MWVKVDDAFPEHRKVVEAGRHLGTYGRGRVIAIWQVGICFCNRNFTDGFIDEPTIRTWTLYDKRPLDVAIVMAQTMPNGDPGLLVRVDGGFRFHDYDDYQPSAAEVKAKKKRDRDRKRQKRLESLGIPVGLHDDSARNLARSRARDPDPSPGLSIGTHTKEHRGSRRVLTMAPENVLKALVWSEARAAVRAGELALADVTERVKQAVVNAGFDYRQHETLSFLCEQTSIALHRLSVKATA